MIIRKILRSTRRKPNSHVSGYNRKGFQLTELVKSAELEIADVGKTSR